MDTELSDYGYHFPKELIAQEPARPRSESRLLVVRKKLLEHKKFHNILDYLKQKNDIYQCRIKTKNPGKGTKIILSSNLTAEVIEEDNGKFFVKFSKTPNLEKYGEIPLPPYIKKKPENYEDYQTVYSENKGSIAAPTAGLHFTEELLKEIEDKGVKIAKIVLHVNYGTFLAIRSDNILAHKMEKEYFEISKNTADTINSAKRIVVVGTTSLRALESAAGKGGKILPKKGWTDIYINPTTGLKSKAELLITNFHLPRTSLLVLVSAFAGRDSIMNAYKEAIKKKYRFYSFGDATLLFRENKHPQYFCL
jgi:S-adenosylmethionine:tRNA ribosyltransferase-isomerase